MLSTKLEIGPAILRHPIMSGDLLQLMEDDLPAALHIPEEELEQFSTDVPPLEWQLDVAPHTWGHRTLTIVAPKQSSQNTAHHAEYWPIPERDRSRLSHIDWNNAAPSPNPGLLAYYVSEHLTAVSVPVMTGPGQRHDKSRQLFVEINDAPLWLLPAQYPSKQGITLEAERALVEEMRQSTSGR